MKTVQRNLISESAVIRRVTRANRIFQCFLTVNSFLLIALLGMILASTKSFAADFRLNRIIDGDTIEVVTTKKEIIVIDLTGIDAPEMPRGKSKKGQPFCKKARERLSEMVINKKFSLQATTRLKNNHVFAVVFSEGKNVNLELIKAGLAEVYRGKLPKGFDKGPYITAEKEAKKKEQGMWALGSVYISPKDWRKADLK